MARDAVAAGLMLLLAVSACGGGKREQEQEAQQNAKIAAIRHKADSMRQARRAADSLELVRFAACADSVKVVLARTKAGRRKLALPVTVGATLPEIATACGQPATRTPALVTATDSTHTVAVGAMHTATATATITAHAAVPPAAKGRSTVDSVRDARHAAKLAADTKLAAAAHADSMHRATDDSMHSDSLHKVHETEVLRESFAYGGGARDPFGSLINQKSSGPELVDLQLVGIYEDLRTNANSVAVLREKDTGKRHKLRVGDQIGRLKVAQIRPKDVVFTIEDFGFERQETISLRKQEDLTP